MTTNPLIWTAFIACLAVSFVLSGMEAGVFALSRLRIRQQMRAGKASAKVLHDYLENPENFLWTILVGNTVANFLILGWLVVKLHAALAESFSTQPKSAAHSADAGLLEKHSPQAHNRFAEAGRKRTF